MFIRIARAAAGTAVTLTLIFAATDAAAQTHDDHSMHATQPASAVPQHPTEHEMFMRDLGSGWRLLGMAQLFPVVSTGFGSDANDAVTRTEFRATQPVVMFNIESPRSRLVLRTTLNFEGITQPEGEQTFGGWGEGFIDRRHPHTLLHEAMLSANFDGVLGGALSLSAGKGFAPYGTDDPMARPAVKYPTNHHLSQILERFTANVAWLRGGWSVEAGIFGGTEPTGPYDFSNIESFGNSWSARVARRLGGTGTTATWEISASYGYVVEEHHDEDFTTRLYNAAIRHDASYAAGRVYGLMEASASDPGDDDGYFSVLGEAQLTRSGHAPYVRLEFATRPEYTREGEPGSDGFFRYDHDDHPIGATRWVITTVGYGYEATRLPFGMRPFVELQHANVVNERGDIAARELFGTNDLFSATIGVRMFFGGGPMRMGAYGVLDAMTEHGRMTMPRMPGHDHD